MVKENTGPILLNVANYAPMQVRAATVGTADHMLWVLDSHINMQPGGSLLMRLVRIDLTSLEHEVIWDGPSNIYNSRHWLSLDRDGHVLLTAAGQGLSNYGTVRFEADPYVLGTAVPVAEHRAWGDLMTSPLVDDQGYFFVLTSGQGLLEHERVPALDPPSPNGLYIGDYM
jgi:hypothetical protein